MPIIIAVGMQWGDEGKGRAVDLLSENADIVARYNGGDNAGHTVTVGEKIFKLHLIPSGIIHNHTIGVLGNGLVLNPGTLLEEMQMLRQAGIGLSPERFWISDAAHFITPAHRLIDCAQESARGRTQIGTTGRGIGPAYVDKSARRGIRVGDLLQPDKLGEKVKQHFQDTNELLTIPCPMNSLLKPTSSPHISNPLARKFEKPSKIIRPFWRKLPREPCLTLTRAPIHT
jgi:adenylosuccinate synthase